jgi:N-acyl-D-amino-acid deacylase
MRVLAAAIFTSILCLGAGCAPAPAGPPGLVIRNARLVDGSGAPAREGGLRVVGSHIVGVGEVTAEPGDTVVDAEGLVLAPGFIDSHSHADDILEHPDALAAVNQGITTLVVGQDGGSQRPLAVLFEGLEAQPAAVNVASFAGFGTLRRAVLGSDYARPATADEIEQMRALLREDLAAGALGLSTGLEYDLQIDAPTDEVVALARDAAAVGGRYQSHVRSEDRGFWAAIDEVVEIGRATGMPVQVTHMKLAMQSTQGQTARLLERLDAARAEGVAITADVYPWTYWQSTITVLFPQRDYHDPKAIRFALEEVTTPEGLLLARWKPDPELEGLTLAEIAARQGRSPAATLEALVSEAVAAREAGEEDFESIIATSMTEDDVAALLAWPWSSVCTDGELDGAHPRGYGSFTRLLGRYVRERGALGLEEAVRHATSLGAENAGIRDRGRLEVGGYADLVLFDPASVIDRATPEDPHALSEGIRGVWVNGRQVFDGTRATGERPGQVLRREASGPR